MNLKDYTDQHTQTALAKQIGAAPSFVNEWVNKKRPIPVRFVVAIEKATNGLVTRREMCPDWETIWPELSAPVKVSRKAVQP